MVCPVLCCALWYVVCYIVRLHCALQYVVYYVLRYSMLCGMLCITLHCRLISVSKKEKVKQRPLALNTVEMLRTASSKLGMGPQYTMQVAERLYTQGYISYPRTETTSYPDNADLRSLS